jgi:Rieske 2Fe-2S family protein
MTTMPQADTLASTLPGRYYYDPAIYALEQERIFSNMWVCVGRAESLNDAGAFQTIAVGQESVIVVRDKEFRLHAFLNVCRHRGTQLCPTTTSGRLKGSIQCKYHAWTYGLDGRLIGAPNILNEESFDRASFGLVPVALEVWEGLIWLNLADNPPSLAEQVSGPIIERFGTLVPFERYRVGELRLGRSISYDVQANWKLVIENFMECYHCGPMHPELCQVLPGFKSGKSYVQDEAATFAEGFDAFTITGKASRPHLPGLLPEDLRRYYGFVIYPNVLINLVDDHVVIHTMYPQGVGSTRVVCDWLFDAKTMKRPDFDPMDAVELFDKVNLQDWEVCELTQLGATSKAMRAGGVYVPAERHIRDFADFVLESLQ